MRAKAGKQRSSAFRKSAMTCSMPACYRKVAVDNKSYAVDLFISKMNRIMARDSGFLYLVCD